MAKSINSPTKKKSFDFVWKAIPIILSSLALLLTVANNCNQNQKWDKLNLGSISVRSVKLFNFREITAQDFKSIDWGYVPSVTSDASTLNPNRLLVQSSVIAFNTKTKKYFRDPFYISIPEIKNQLIADREYDSASIQFLKHYYVIIEIENVGGTDCKLLTEHIKFMDRGTEVSTSLGEEVYTLPAKRISISKFKLDIPIEQQFPTPIKMEITYTNIKNQKKVTKALLTYDGGWRISEY